MKIFKNISYSFLILLFLLVSCSNINSSQVNSNNYKWLATESYHYFINNPTSRYVTRYQYQYYNSSKDYKYICLGQNSSQREKTINTSTIISNNEIQIKNECYKFVENEWILSHEITTISDLNTGLAKMINIHNYLDSNVSVFYSGYILVGMQNIPANSEFTKSYTIDLINYDNGVYLYKQTDIYDSSSFMFYEIKDSVIQKAYTNYQNGNLKKEWIIASADNDFLKTVFNNGYGFRHSYLKEYDENGTSPGGSDDFVLENVSHDDNQFSMQYTMGGSRWGYTYRKTQIPF